MIVSRYEYVRAFERDEILLPNTWIVVRIDGRGFHKLSNTYSFTKPNDKRALDLMNRAAQSVFSSVPDLCIAYGVSDEYSFVLHKSTTLFERRSSKIVSTIVSTFTAAYIFHWPRYFGAGGGGGDGDHQSVDLQENWLPTFDGRAVCYPTIGNLRDYLSWRQVDCHINNLYNTTFWMLIQRGKHTTAEAEKLLKGTLAADKNEILFSRFGINYNNEDEMYRKGSVVFREFQTVNPTTSSGGQISSSDAKGRQDALSLEQASTGISDEVAPSKSQQEKTKKARQKTKIVVRHQDIIKDDFWDRRPWILTGKPGIPLSD